MSNTPSELNEMALQLHNHGQFYEADVIFQKILGEVNDSYEVFNNYGNTLTALGQFENAAQAYRQALDIKPDFGEAYNNLANVLHLSSKFDEAQIAIHQALILIPDSAEAYNNFGNILMDFEQFEEAEQAYRKAVLLSPEYSEAYNNRGNALKALERWAVAEKSYRQAITINPDYPEAYKNLGVLLAQTGHVEAAEKSFRQAIALKPDFAGAYNNLGLILIQVCRYDEAEKAYLQAITLMPDDAIKKFNLSLLYLLLGHLEKGFELYEQRFDGGSGKAVKILKDQFKALQCNKRWEGDSIVAKSLLVIAEQGAGDNLMMMRYLPLLKQQNLGKLIISCDPNLRRLFESMPEIDEVITLDESLPVNRIDIYCAMMSFPHLFKTKLETIPNKVPYLSVSEIMKKKWKNILRGCNGLKVGVVWAGNRQYLNDHSRSILLSEFSPLIEVKGVHLISLQKGEDAGQLKNTGWDISDWMEMCEDYLDTAALISEIDLVISVDTSVAHLAGALGKPVWLLNRFESEWRWLLARSDSPWYPTMRIYRQREGGDWGTIMAQIAGDLAEYVSIR